MQNDADRFFVLTGGPGSGKTTLIEALRQAGFATSVEAGRGIIRDQSAIGGTALPWSDRALFAELMLSWEMRSYRAAAELAGPVFFDRGVPDTIGYLRLCGLPVPGHLTSAAMEFRYARRVFVAPHGRKSSPRTKNASKRSTRPSALINQWQASMRTSATNW